MLYILAYLPVILMLLIFIGGAALIIWYFKAFYAERDARQQRREEQFGGEYTLRWKGSYAQGAPDAEFGQVVVEVPKKNGSGAARFYEKGLVLENKRLPYSEIKDVLCAEAKPGKKHTLKQAVRDMGVLWIYPKKGATIGIRELNYQFDNEVMQKIRKGLGFGDFEG